MLAARVQLPFFAICAVTGMLALGNGATDAQAAPSGSASFHERVEKVARALRNNPRLRNFSEEQRVDRVEFVIGNTLFALLHEMGHVVIAEMDLPVLGREEDAADTYAALRMLKISTGFSERTVAEASKEWFLNGRRDRDIGAKPLYYDQHSLDQQRAYWVVCLMVGSDRTKFKGLADQAHVPQPRQESCKKDYAKTSGSWDEVLKPHLRGSEQPETKISVLYGDAPAKLAVFARSFRAVRMLEMVARRSAAEYAWPAPFTLEMRSCGRPVAVWDDKARSLRVCYELAFDFAELYRAYVADGPARTATTRTRGRKLR